MRHSISPWPASPARVSIIAVIAWPPSELGYTLSTLPSCHDVPSCHDASTAASGASSSSSTTEATSHSTLRDMERICVRILVAPSRKSSLWSSSGAASGVNATLMLSSEHCRSIWTAIASAASSSAIVPTPSSEYTWRRCFDVTSIISDGLNGFIASYSSLDMAIFIFIRLEREPMVASFTRW